MNLEIMAFGEITVNATDKNPVLGKTKNTYYKIISRQTRRIQVCLRIHR
jgi:hypothetical protein